MTSPTPSEPRTGQQLYHAAPFTLAQAAGVTATAIATIYVVQIVLVGTGVPDLVAAAISDSAVLVGVVVYLRGRGLRLHDAGVRRTPPRFIAAAVLLGLSMWYLTASVVELVDPPGDTEKLQQFVTQTPLVPTLVALTIFPALAEELVFRGILTRTLVSRYRYPVAVAISAAVFGAYHLNPPQILTTFLLGLVLAHLTLRSGSIVPSIIVHLLNNTIAIVLPRNEVPAATAWIIANPAMMLTVALAAVGCALAISAKGVA
ncbi:MAG TPA: CPBP family intramembrane glutamic endopeptidase [Kofleriaceae bacterium]